MNGHDLYTILTSPWALALIAIAMERWLPWPEQWHPVALFRLFADYLQSKVNRPDYAPSQQKLAGAMSVILLLVLTLIPTAIVVYAADLSQFLGALVLLACIRQQHLLKTLNRVDRFALAGQKRAARSLLARVDWRDARQLSIHGLIKTSAELRAMSLIEHRYVPVIGWLIGGPILALATRVIIELHHIWPVSAARFCQFGAPARTFYVLLTSPVTLFLTGIAGLFILFGTTRKATPLVVSRGWVWPTAAWLDAFSRLHNIALGGPLKIDGRRIARQRFSGRPPEQHYRALRARLAGWQMALPVVLSIVVLLLFIYRP